MAHLTKAERQHKINDNTEREKRLEMALQFSKKRFKNFEDVIEDVYCGKDLSFVADKRIAKIQTFFNKLNGRHKSGERKLLRNALVYLAETSGLVGADEYIDVVCNMIQLSKQWRRDFFRWKPQAKQLETQVQELAAHLFCLYPVPQFLFKAFSTGNSLFTSWFIHIGGGGRVRDMENIPIPFTQKMGHYFLQSPEQFSITEALRWAQVKGLNGNDELAERVAYSWLSAKPFKDELFWQSFLQLIIAGGMFNLAKLGELIDYVRETKRINNDYHLKGRTLQSLLRQSDEWHHRYSQHRGNSVWKPSGISGFKAEKKNTQVVLEELTEAAQLSAEGKTMKHCVGSYAFYCAKGKTAIFSLRKYADGLLLDTMATIEVNLALGKIVQAKARMNRPLSDEAVKYMTAWSEAECLDMGVYL